MTERRGGSDQEWGALGIVAALVILVLLIGVIYFAWRWSQRQQAVPPATGPAATQTAPSGPVSADRLVYGGQPKPRPGVNLPVKVLRRIGYVLGYSEERKNPAWVCYRVYEVPNPAGHPRPPGFAVDPETAARVTSADYNGAVFGDLKIDRGHMAPNHAIDICYGEKAQLQTFLMSNVCPQTHVCNAGPWEKLEAMELKSFAPRYKEVWVVDGPIFGDNPPRIRNGVQVPAAFFKILLEQQSGKPRVMAVIMPQTATITDPPGKYTSTVRTIEDRTGLEFFPDLPAEERQRMENAPPTMW